MSELRYLSTDGEYLLLEAADGTQFSLLIDESIRKAARRETVSEDDASKISPRGIQLEVRAGISVAELAAKTGASLEYIEKFAEPVIDELDHVVSSALSVRITMAGDRYSETTQVEFGNVIANRLAATGVVKYTWTARKAENGGWQLQCKYGDTLANWAFDPRKLSLSPENEVAVQLSTQQSLTDGPLPKLRPVVDQIAGNESNRPTPMVGSPITQQAPTPTQQAAAPREPERKAPAPVVQLTPVTPPPAQTQTSPEPASSSTQVPTQIAPADNQKKSITEDLGGTAEFEGVVPFGRSSKPAPESEPADLANTADLLDALRKRRMSREEDLAQDPDITTDTSSISLVQKPKSVPNNNEFTETQPIELPENPESSGAEEETKTTPKRGRSSMPSWDEIVFSTKTDDED